MRRLRTKRIIAGWIAVLPALALVILIMWSATLSSVYYSFTDWNGVDAAWVGLRNYERLLSSSLLLRALGVNVILLIAILALIVFPFFIALLVSRMKRFQAVARVVLFTPAALSWVVVGLTGRFVFTGDRGLNAVLDFVGLGELAPDWLGSPGMALAALILLIVWSLFGISFVIFLGAIGVVDERVVEAAHLDGASELRIAVQIIAPAISSHVRLVAIWSTTTVFGSLFALIYVFTGGGPAFATTPVEYLVYTLGFGDGNFALGAAAGVILLLLLMIANAPQLWSYVGKRDEEAL